MGIADLTGGVVKGCVQWLDLGQREQDAGHLQYVHVPLAVLDAVFSINTKYKAAQNVVARYRAYAEVDDNQEHSITTFLQLASNFGPDDFAGQVLKNRQRTSTRGGILKAEAAIEFAQVLNDFGVRYLADIDRIIDSDRFCRRVRRIPGQSLSLDYFLMMMGRTDLIKADRMVMRFLSKCTGEKAISVPMAQCLITEASKILSTSYPHLTPRLLDWIVWQHESAIAQM